MNLLILYFIGLAAVIQFHVVWSRTTFSVHAWNALHPKEAPIFTLDALIMASLRYGAMGDLWICATCAGFWFSILVGAALALFSDSWWLLVVGASTWTGLAAVFVGHKFSPRPAPELSAAPLSVFPTPPEAKPKTGALVLASLPEPSAKSKQAILIMMEGMRSSAAQQGALKTVPPLFSNLKLLLDHPVNDASLRVSALYKKAKAEMEAGDCLACDQGALIRHCLMLLYDAGFTESHFESISRPASPLPSRASA